MDLEQAALIDMRDINISSEMLSKFKLLTSEANRDKPKTFVTVVTTQLVVCVEVASSKQQGQKNVLLFIFMFKKLRNILTIKMC